MARANKTDFTRAAIAGLFFFSGALALVYEAIWQRRFALVFGSSAPATAAVLAAYFAGLALGSWGLPNRKPTSRPLRTYALLEIGIGAGALLTEVLATFFDQRQSPETGRVFIKVIETFICLALPTYCMGRTLPVLGAYVDQQRNHLGRTAGLLYVLNTLGAAVGVLIFPFVLLPSFGARMSLFICVAGNIAIALIAFALDRKAAPAEAPESEQLSLSIYKHPAGLAFVSGFVTFVAQVLWNRAFAQVHENSLYSFAIIAAAFIFALAIGGQAARIALRRSDKPERVIETVWIIAGLMLVTAPWFFYQLTDRLAFIPAHSRGRLIALAFEIVVPGAILLGVALPIVFEIAGRLAPRSASTVLGRLLTINLLGAVSGALVAGFILPQLVGLWRGLMLAGALLMVCAISKRTLVVRVIVLVALLLKISQFDLPRVRVLADRGEKLVSIQEGAHGIAAVIDRDNSRRLKLNNAYVLGGTASTGDERMQSHIPLLLHPKPDKVAYMGLGTGISAGAALFHPVKEITILELCPEVAAAARTHFADANKHILDQPNTRLILDDARNYFRHTDQKFDVIISDLVVPWRPGEATLFTKETMEAAKATLKPGGIYCQWLPMFQLSEWMFETQIETFLAVFPDAQFWRGDFSPNEPSLAIIAGAEGHRPIEERIKQMSADPSNPQISHTLGVQMYFSGAASEGLRTFQNTEDYPALELLGQPETGGFVGRRLMDRIAKGLQEKPNGPGDLLAEFTLALSENNRAEADRLQLRLKEIVPPELYKILFPEDAK